MKKITNFLTPIILTFVTPLFFLPITLSFFQTNKLLLIVVATLVMLLATALEHLLAKKHQHAHTPLTWPLAIFWVVTIVNLALTQEARFESLTETGAIFLSLPLLTHFLSVSAEKESEKQNQGERQNSTRARWTLIGLIGSGTALSLLGIAQLVFLADFSRLPIWMQNLGFTPAGSVLNLLIVATVSIAAALAWGLKEQKLITKTSLFAAAGVNLSALVAYLSLIIPGERLAIRLLPIQAGWSIALDTLKAGRQLLVGVGLANFPVLYTRFKPSAIAQTDLWTAVFNHSSTELLHLLSTMGVVGVTAFILVGLAVLKLAKQLATSDSPLDAALRWSLITLLVSFVILPASVVTYTLFFVLAGVAASRTLKPQNIKTINLPNYARYSSATVLAAAILISGYFSYRVYAAERALFKSQQALAQNDANAVYQAYTRAIQLAPKKASYRTSFAQINLQLASSLSQATQGSLNAESETTGQETTNKETEAKNAQKPRELTEQERQQISTLVQRAVEQGRIATQLRPSYFGTWQNLGATYRNLINVAQDAENFALQNLQQAVQLNPADPSLRVELGGLYYQLANLVSAQQQQLAQAQAQIDPEAISNLLDQAVQQFKTAVNLKPNYANGYYNLAKAYEAKENYRSAYQAMQLTLANLEPDSADYQTAQKELLALEKKLPQTQQQAEATQAQTQQKAPSNLQQPEPLPSPLPGGPIELPEEGTAEDAGTKEPTTNPLQEINQANTQEQEAAEATGEAQ